MHRLARLDHRYLWHPFTQMREWLRREPIVIVEGKGAVLRDVHGREYLDANASIWTNLHGHRHPRLNAAIRRQLGRIAHSSSLGLANEPAALLGERLVQLANPRWLVRPAGRGSPRLGKVFFSDDGSTAVEVALKLAYEYTRRTKSQAKPRFLSLEGAYHGDTVGAVALGHIPAFHQPYRGLLFATDAVMAPYCYRCPFNRARPERADARSYRQCGWECVDQVQRAFERRCRRHEAYAGLVLEPRIQGAAGMIPQPAGWLARVAQIARGYGSLLVADEVLTGLGRTGFARDDARGERAGPLFACHHEGVQPDFLCLAKGLSGGYLPLAATLTSQAVFDAFLGESAERRTFYHGHSYTGNQLGTAAALANLQLLEEPATLQRCQQLQHTMSREIARLWSLPAVGDIRQVGLIAGIELVRDWRRRTPFDPGERVGVRVCEAMARQGVLTRPIGDVIVLMPPFCTSDRQLSQMVAALAAAIESVLGRDR